MIKQKIKFYTFSVLKAGYQSGPAVFVRPIFHRLRTFLNQPLLHRMDRVDMMQNTLQHQIEVLQVTLQQAQFIAPLRHEVRLQVAATQILQQRVQRLEQGFEETLSPGLQEFNRLAALNEQILHRLTAIHEQTAQKLAVLQLDVESATRNMQIEVSATTSNVEKIRQDHHESMNDLDKAMHDLVDKIETIVIGIVGKSDVRL